MEGYEYFAFISYSHKDQELARRLKRRLHRYHLPSRLKKLKLNFPKKLRPIFLDESSLVSEGSLRESLRKNLENSKYLIVLCSPNSAQSEYVNDEVQYFMELGRSERIIPLIVGGVPHSESEECFPLAIRELPREQELLGIDLTKFGEREAFLRVIATMLGLNLDRFVADEERERRRRVFGYISLIVGVVVVMVSLFVYGIYQTDRRRNESEAQYERGFTYEKIKNYAQAMEWYLKAANNGNSAAKNNIGSMYYYGRGVETNYTKAMEWFLKAADNGDFVAQFNIGCMYRDGEGVEQDYSKAMEWYLKAAANGHSLAQYTLGYMYYYGRGVERDYAKAIEWFLKAAANGNTSAQNHIGYMYESGLGVEKDYAKAMNWYLKAAFNGNTTAQNNIGYMYHFGLGVEKDYAKAMNWYLKAVDSGNISAQNNIGVLYENGLGVERDYGKAMECYLKAADNGNDMSQYHIGFLYENGLGVEKDYSKAIEWYSKAAAKGNTKAQERLNELKTKLQPTSNDKN